ncbi:MAG: hypothetical protein QXJ15_01695 [Candidatus Bathyarchaeia archaeon]
MLKAHEVSAEDRKIVFQALKSEIVPDAVLPLTPEVMAKALGSKSGIPT